jgi:predicted lipid-binding transport protein (Tim44 family)
MKKILIGMMLAISAFALLAEAQARPMGGGRSIGRQSQNVSRHTPTTAPAPAPAQRQAATPAAAPGAPAMAPKPASPWKGMLGGALLGLGLGALLSHFGLGGAMASMLGSILMIALLALAALFIYRMFSKKSAPAPYAGFGGGTAPAGAGNTPEIGSRMNLPASQAPGSGVGLNKAAPAQWGVPADFDTDVFLRHAKSNFIRLQAAWDKGDTHDIAEFTTPEVYAELKMQMAERGATPDFTDVVTIDGELLGIETVGDEYLASVKFTGMIKAAPNAPAEPFAEAWNLSKPVSGSGGWVLSGIQQLS